MFAKTIGASFTWMATPESPDDVMTVVPMARIEMLEPEKFVLVKVRFGTLNCRSPKVLIWRSSSLRWSNGVTAMGVLCNCSERRRAVTMIISFSPSPLGCSAVSESVSAVSGAGCCAASWAIAAEPSAKEIPIAATLAAVSEKRIAFPPIHIGALSPLDSQVPSR